MYKKIIGICMVTLLAAPFTETQAASPQAPFDSFQPLPSPPLTQLFQKSILLSANETNTTADVPTVLGKKVTSEFKDISLRLPKGWSFLPEFGGESYTTYAGTDSSDVFMSLNRTTDTSLNLKEIVAKRDIELKGMPEIITATTKAVKISGYSGMSYEYTLVEDQKEIFVYYIVFGDSKVQYFVETSGAMTYKDIVKSSLKTLSIKKGQLEKIETAPKKKAEKATPPKSLSSKVTSKFGDVSLSVPKGWKVASEGDDNDMVMTYINDPKYGTGADLTIARFITTGNLKSMTKLLEDEFIKSGLGKIVSKESISRGKFKGTAFEFQLEPGLGSELATYYILFNGNKQYTIVANTPLSYNKIIQKSLGSISIDASKFPIEN